MCLDHTFPRSDHSKWVLFGLIDDEGAGRTTSILSNDTVEYQN